MIKGHVLNLSAPDNCGQVSTLPVGIFFVSLPFNPDFRHHLPRTLTVNKNRCRNPVIFPGQLQFGVIDVFSTAQSGFQHLGHKITRWRLPLRY